MAGSIAKLLTGMLLAGVSMSVVAGQEGTSTSHAPEAMPSGAVAVSTSARPGLYPMGKESPGASFDNRPIRAQVTAIRKTVMPTEINGRISQLQVNEGSAFQQGEVLAKIDCGLYRAQLDKAKAMLDSATSRHKTIKRLAELKSKGKLELELAEIEVRKARADLAMITTQVEHCVIKAPFSGLVSEKLVDEQQYVQTGTPLLRVIDDSRLQVEFIAPSRYLRWLKPGAALQLAIDETGKSYPAVIQRFGADVDAVSQSIKVFAELDNQHRELMAGMSGRVTLTPPQENSRQVAK